MRQIGLNGRKVACDEFGDEALQKAGRGEWKILLEVDPTRYMHTVWW